MTETAACRYFFRERINRIQDTPDILTTLLQSRLRFRLLTAIRLTHRGLGAWN